jgi:hypothetical protein
MPFGEISIEFTDNKDLEEQLEKIDFEGLTKVVGAKVGIIAEPKRIREELKDLCDTDGKYMIFKKAPTKKVEKVMFAIYCYGTSATLDEIRRTSGITDPSGNVIGPNAKYFLSLGNKIYGLSDAGIQTVTQEVIPALREKR